MNTKIRMGTNIRTNTKKVSDKVIYPELSYSLVGVFFEIHTELGMYAREKQYADLVEQKLKIRKIPYKRELGIANTGNVVDFFVDEKIVLELKAKRMLTRDDYRQLQHYLQETQKPLGLLINFREKYVKPIRVVRIDTVKQLQYNRSV